MLNQYISIEEVAAEISESCMVVKLRDDLETFL
jgi:hypothetical protein